MGYLRRQLITAALTANAIRPPSTMVTGLPAMFAGWLVSELSPHFLAVTAADTAHELTRGVDGRRRALLGVANLAGLAFVLHQGDRSREVFESALLDGLGEDYHERLAQYDDLDWKTPLRHLAWPFAHKVPAVDVVKDVSFAPQYGARGCLDVYRPRTPTTGAPVLLQIHGGGWTIGKKDQQGLPLMKHMASRGWVCFAPNYRLAPRDPFPAQIVDVKRAIAWVREHAEEYGADPSFIAITGGSAGGHLAALAALTPNDPEYQPGFEDADTGVQAAVPFYGLYDLAAVSGSKAARRMRDFYLGPVVFQRDPRREWELFEKASPLLRVRQDAPPFYVIHGANDSVVEITQARQFVEALREASDQAVAFSELSYTQHAFDIFPSVRSQHSVRGVEKFLRWAYDSWRGVPGQRSDAEWEARDPLDA